MAGTGLPLAGIRVVEMSHMVMGPTCGMILAQLGAEVIKVEPPTGDKTRNLGGMGVGFFSLFNRGKRSMVLDLAQPEGRAAMYRLLETADVFLENFRSGPGRPGPEPGRAAGPLSRSDHRRPQGFPVWPL
jgi:formyl-CoA transferase